MQIEYADVSLLGHRDDNQDRVSIAVAENAALLAVVDGMGGHAEGAKAAETSLASMLESFWQMSHPVFDPLGFLHIALSRAHDDVVSLGADLALETRPRATCALCLVQDGAAYWAHVGDSRVYQIRAGSLRERTRDHSHVEVLLAEGVITEAEVQGHPMRNFVECCIGGDHAVPEMTVATRKALSAGDIVLLCTDGLWANLNDAEIAGFHKPGGKSLRESLEMLGKRAVQASAPYSDNTTAAALRWMG